MSEGSTPDANGNCPSSSNTIQQLSPNQNLQSNNNNNNNQQGEAHHHKESNVQAKKHERNKETIQNLRG
jgi:hypothetical protein